MRRELALRVALLRYTGKGVSRRRIDGLSMRIIWNPHLLGTLGWRLQIS